jgi:hypothetical protein
MAGGRKGRRKPGHGGPGENEVASYGQNTMAADAGREKTAETGDIEAEQWLNPFRIGRPVTPVISHRQNVADPSGSQFSHGLPRGEPIRAVPVQAVPVEGAPVQGVPVQIWHEPPPDETWQHHGQRPAVEPERGDGRDLRGELWAARGEPDGYLPGDSAIHGNDYGPQAYYMDVPGPSPGGYPARGYYGGRRPGPDERGSSIRGGNPSGYGSARVYRGRDSYPPAGPGRDEGHPGYQGFSPGDAYGPRDGHGRPGYPPPAYGPPGGYGPPGEYGPPGSDARRGRGAAGGRDPGQSDYGRRGRDVRPAGHGSPDSYGSQAGYVRPDGYAPPSGYRTAGDPGRLLPDGQAARYRPGYQAEDSFAPDYDAPPPRYGPRGYGRWSGPGNPRDQQTEYGPPPGYRGRPGHGAADAYGPDPGYRPITGYGQPGQRAQVPHDQYGRRNQSRADDGDREQLPRRARQGYGPSDAQSVAEEPWRRDLRRPGAPDMPADPARQRPPAESAWDGRSRRLDGYGQQSRPQPAPGDRFWDPGDAATYDAGGVRRGYDRRLRAAYGPGDAASRGQRQWRDPGPDPSADVAASSRGRAEADRSVRQGPRPGASAGPARKIALPAALPPGPSTSAESGNTKATGSGTPATSTSAGSAGSRERQAHPDPAIPAGTASPQLAGGSGGPRPAAALVTAATPPSPTGTVPPAASTLPQPVRVTQPASADPCGYDVVSPDAETTPMAVILGDSPPVTDDAASPQRAAGRPIAEQRSVDLRPESTPAVSATGPRMRGPFEPANNLAPPPAAPPTPQSAVQPASASTASAWAGSLSAGSGARAGVAGRPGVGANGSDSPEPGAASAGSAELARSAETAESAESAGLAASAKMDQIKDLYLTAEAIGEDALDRHFQLVSDRQRQLIREYFNQAIPGQAEAGDVTS